MFEWPYGTRVKPGQPETISVGSAIIEQMMGSVQVHNWLYHIIPLIDPTEMSTEDLCSQPPPPSESWGIQDMINGLHSETHQLVIDKIARMVRASLWPTYCEFVPRDEAGPIYGTPRMVGTPYTTYMTPHTAPTFETSIGGWDGIDFLLVAVRVITERPTLAADPWPEIYAPRPEGWTGDPPQEMGFFGGQEGTVQISTTPVRGLQSDPRTGPVEFLPNTGVLRFVMPEESGDWYVEISRWALDLAAPAAEPWPEAPLDPCAGLDAALIAALKTMTDEWTTHRVTTSLLPGMVTEVLDHVDGGIAELLAALGQLGVQPAGFGDGGDNHMVNGGGTFDVPAGAVGFYVFVEQPAGADTFGDNPETLYGIGFATQSWGDGVFYPGERIQHNAQIFYPLKPGVNQVWFDLQPSVVVSFNWLVPIIP